MSLLPEKQEQGLQNTTNGSKMRMSVSKTANFGSGMGAKAGKANARPERKPLGVLGKYVTALMIDRNIRSQRELSELLWERAGYDASQQRLSKWFTDRAQADAEFPAALRKTLELSIEETGDLVWVFALGEMPPSEHHAKRP